MSMALPNKKSQALFSRAQKVLVGGVDSPVRAFAAVGGTPPFIANAKGSALTDADGNRYIDYVCSYGPMILGHAHERVMTAITKAVHKGTSYGAPTESEIKLADAIVQCMPAIEKVRFVSSGTEALMTAIRLARGFTGRSKIVKCIGCYHGHSDCLLVSAGSGALTLGVPSSPGVPEGTTAQTLLAPYNDLPAMEHLLGQAGEQVAAVLVEPVAANMGVVLPAEGYLAGLRKLCDRTGTLLIFDEVITGFRMGLGGAQGLYGVRPDLTTLGKIIGGGMPVGALGGPAKIMDMLAPLGPVYQAGTLSGNPIAMAAGLATLAELRGEGFYQRLEASSRRLFEGLEQAITTLGLGDRVTLNRAGSMMTPFFAAAPVKDFATATACNTAAYARFFHAMLADGIYLAPSQYEAMFVSAAHSDEDIDTTVSAAADAMAKAFTA